MYYYCIYGMNVCSEFEIEAAHVIPAFAPSLADVHIHAGELGTLTVETPRDIERGKGFCYNYEPMRGWIRVIHHGCFMMQNGNEIIYQFKDGYDPLYMAEVILCLCLSVIIIQKRGIILHGSALLWNDRAIMVSGASGSGKSTLTQALLEAGGIFMADDTVRICVDNGTPYAYSSFPQQKLVADAAKKYGIDRSELIRLSYEEEEKYARRLKERYCSEKQVLQAMVILQIQDDAERGCIKKITGNNKLKHLTDNLYKKNAYELMGFSQEQFMQSVQVANQIDVLLLSRPPIGLDINEEVAMVLDALKAD